MSLISGEKYSEVVKISNPSAVAGRVVFVTFMGSQGPYPGCLSTGYDIKFSTVAAPTTALSNYRLRFSYPDGTVAKGNFFAQYMVLVPANSVGDLLVQWGDGSATDTSSYWAVHQLPNAADCNALEVWPMTESGNFTGTVGGVVLTISGDTTHRRYDDQPFAKRSARIVSGPDPVNNSTVLGMYTNTTGYAQADAGFLDTPPPNLCINFGFFGSGVTGDILGKYSDANNYFRLEYVSGNLLKLTLAKAGVVTTFTTLALTNYTDTAMITIQMGDAGLELLINSCPVYRNTAVTGTWGAGSGGKLTLGGRDTGSGVSNKCAAIMVMTLAVYARRLTYGELGYLSYHCRPPTGLTTMADKIHYQRVLVDGTGSGENGLVQEFEYLGAVNGVHHAIYHGGSSGQIFHMTGADVSTLVRDGNGAVLGGGVNGESLGTLAIAGHRTGDAFIITYNNTNASSNLKYTVTSDFVTFSTPATLVAKRTGDWPAGNTNAAFDDGGAQLTLLIEGVGVGTGTYTTGAARGPDWLHLTLDASTNNGTLFTTASPTNSLMFSGGFGANNGNNSFVATQSGGPFIWAAPNGIRHVFFHGHAGMFYSSAGNTFIYMRKTVDYINYAESPTEVIMGPLTEVLAGADQLADFCITDLNGTIVPIAWGEFFYNSGATSVIAQFTFSASGIQDFVTDSPNASLPLPPVLVTSTGTARARAAR